MSKLSPIFDPGDLPLRLVVLFSGSASGGRYLLEARSPAPDYCLAAAICDEPSAEGISLLEEEGVPVKVLAEGSGDYFRRLLTQVERYEPDIVLLSGFMKVVKEPLLGAYRGRMINVHPADLRVEEGGSRKFTGGDAVYDAVTSGEREVRSTVHVVTEQIDEGPILTVSRPFRVENELVETLQRRSPSDLRNYVDALQEWMKWSGDGPSLEKAVRLYAQGRVAVSGSEILLKGEAGFGKGYFDMEREELIMQGAKTGGD